MQKKILIIGKRSFIGQNLFNYFNKKKVNVKICSFDEVKKKDYNLNKFNFIINSSTNKHYIGKKYLEKNDHDLAISKKIKHMQNKMIFLSSRKLYKSGYNLKETDKIKPEDNYSKNKYISEKKLYEILGERLIILRISNVIGFTNNQFFGRKVHRTFIDIFIENIKKGIILKQNKIYKDFISSQKLSEIVYKIILKNLNGGIYNVSLGKKIFISEIVEWLNYYNNNKVKVLKLNPKYHNKDSFTLNNNKLMKSIKLKNTVAELKKECVKISKKLFYRYEK